MRFKKALSALALGVAAVGAHALPTIQNADGLKSFGGFDWAQGGTAYTTGFAPVAGTKFTLNFYSWAVALQDAEGGNLVGLTMDTNANGSKDAGTKYEYTIFATLYEEVTACTLQGCSFSLLTGSTFDIYYDTTPDAKKETGTGFLDGTLIASGTLDVSGDSGSFNSPSLNKGRGISTLTGILTQINGSFLSNDFLSATTTVGTTLQQGVGFETNKYTRSGFNGTAFTAGNIVLQADANQSFEFAAVPEPGSLALAGLALVIGGAASRRRLKK